MKATWRDRPAVSGVPRSPHYSPTRPLKSFPTIGNGRIGTLLFFVINPTRGNSVKTGTGGKVCPIGKVSQVAGWREEQQPGRHATVTAMCGVRHSQTLLSRGGRRVCGDRFARELLRLRSARRTALTAAAAAMAASARACGFRFRRQHGRPRNGGCRGKSHCVVAWPQPRCQPTIAERRERRTIRPADSPTSPSRCCRVRELWPPPIWKMSTGSMALYARRLLL